MDATLAFFLRAIILYLMQGQPWLMPGQPQLPGAMPGQPQLPGAMPGQPQLPGAMPGQPQLPGAMPGQPQLPGTMPGQQPSSQTQYNKGSVAPGYYPPMPQQQPHLSSQQRSKYPTPAPVVAPSATLVTDGNGVHWTWSSFPTSYASGQRTGGAAILDSVANLVGAGSGGAANAAGKGNGSTSSPTAIAAMDNNRQSLFARGDSINHLTLPDDMIVPLAALYTPLTQPGSGVEVKGSEASNKSILYTRCAPLNCRQCGAFMTYANSTIDSTSRHWSCPACQTRNQLPPDFALALPTASVPQPPAAIHGTPLDPATVAHPALAAPTVEYILPTPPADRPVPVFMLLVDVAVEPAELAALQTQLHSLLEHLPHESLIGIITFGKNVNVWDVGSEEDARCYSIRGNRSFPLASHGVHIFSNSTAAVAQAEAAGIVVNPRERDSASGWMDGLTGAISALASSPYSPLGGSGQKNYSVLTTTTNASAIIAHDATAQNQRLARNSTARAQELHQQRGTSLEPATAPVHPPKTVSEVETSSSIYLRTLLGISPEAPHVYGRFLVPLNRAEFAISAIIDDLTSDPLPDRTGVRQERATGTGLEAAIAILEALEVTHLGKILMFTGGPATRGPGTIVPLDKGQMMRSHRDIIDGDIPLYEKALTFYRLLEQRLQQMGTSVDSFVASYDQVGILELRHCINNTGGVFVCQDSFADPMFITSLRRYCALRDLKLENATGGDGSKRPFCLDAQFPPSAFYSGYHPASAAVDNSPILPASCGYNAVLEVHTSRDTLVSGAIGPCRSVPLTSADLNSTDTATNNPNRLPFTYALPCGSNLGPSERLARLRECHTSTRHISSHSVGEGGTQRWVLASVDSGLTLAVVFDTATLDPPPANATNYSPPRIGSHRFVQFVLRYTTVSGERRVRVTSLTHHISPITARMGSPFTTEPSYFITHKCFDQAAAAALIGRMAVASMEDYSPNCWASTKRWVDRTLVRFVRRFGSFRTGAPESLMLDASMSLLPSFIYNLRRSEYFMTMNISPDETVFKRSWLMRESCEKAIVMIQPTLFSYAFDCPTGAPVPLDSNSIKLDNILLLDTFFSIHIVWGVTIAEWRRLGYDKDPNYYHFASLLQAPEMDAALLLAERFPYPRFSKTDINGGEARHLKTRLNPSATYQERAAKAQQQAGAIMNTDDASISAFMETLRRAVVDKN